MATRTVHVVAADGSWVTRRGTGRKRFFETKSEAIAAARKLAREHRPSQVVVLESNGRIRFDANYGLPKLPDIPYRGKIGRKNIERAVAEVVRASVLKD